MKTIIQNNRFLFLIGLIIFAIGIMLLITLATNPQLLSNRGNADSNSSAGQQGNTTIGSGNFDFEDYIVVEEIPEDNPIEYDLDEFQPDYFRSLLPVENTLYTIQEDEAGEIIVTIGRNENAETALANYLRQFGLSVSSPLITIRYL